MVREIRSEQMARCAQFFFIKKKQAGVKRHLPICASPPNKCVGSNFCQIAAVDLARGALVQAWTVHSC
jgi:hypothetical protein